MGSAERSAGHQVRSIEHSGNRVKLRDLEGLVTRQLGENCRQTPGKHRLARTRRADHENIVTARRRNFERPPSSKLTSDFRKIDAALRRGGKVGRRNSRWIPGIAQEACDLAQSRRSNDAQTFDQRGFFGVCSRNDYPVESRGRRRQGDGEDSGCRHQSALQRQLSRKGKARQPSDRHLAGRGHDTHRNRQIQPGSVLSKIYRREIDDHSPKRPFESRAFDRRADSLARIVNRRSGQARQTLSGQASSDRGLNGNRMSPHAENRNTDNTSVHSRDNSARV